MQPYTNCGGLGCNASGPEQFAVYTVDQSCITTNDTWQNMTASGLPMNDEFVSFSFSPDDQYFAATDGSASVHLG